MLVDAALRGMVVALLLLAAGFELRDRPRLPAAQAGAPFTVGHRAGLQLDAELRAARGMFRAIALVGISAANAVLFWLFVRTLDDDFRWRPGSWWSGLWLSLSER